jgi:nucleoside-triphosphatase THEP1
MAARTVILSGERGVGKTTVCRKTIALARAREYICGGVLTLSYPNDVRDVLDVHSGRTRRLTLEPNANSPAAVMGRFRFDPETLAWGNDVLARAPACHLLVVDELGPLEIERGRGWHKAFDALRGNSFGLALVIVRPELVEQARLILPHSPTITLCVTPQNRDSLPGALLDILEGKSALS